jgi:dTDP-4-dehydrorhamnose reductase
MKILLIGALGQLGKDLQPALAGEEMISVDKEEIDVCDIRQVDSVVDAVQPDLLLNCSAFHRVDECEDAPEAAFAVNVFGVRNLALAARRSNAVMVHFSTDYVFDGTQRRPHVETDMPCPRSVYGVSKLAGEFMLQSIWPKHFLIRTCGLYGYAGSREKGTNFVESMIRLAEGSKPVRVVNDQICTPTSTMDLAGAVTRLIQTDAYGLYHLTSAGECTWYDFACAIFELAGLNVEVLPVTSDQFPAKARRPAYSVLDNQRFRALGFEDLRHWKDALRAYLERRGAARRA